MTQPPDAKRAILVAAQRYEGTAAAVKRACTKGQLKTRKMRELAPAGLRAGDASAGYERSTAAAISTMLTSSAVAI